MKPIHFAEAPAAAWDAICVQSPQAWLFHRSAWITIEQRWFVRTNHSFALRVGSELVAIQPLYLSDAGAGTGGERLLHSGIHRHTGLALLPGLTEASMKAARSAAMHRILEVAEQEDVDRIQLNAQNLAPENLGLGRSEIPFWVEDWSFEPGLAFTSFGMLPAPGMATCSVDQIVDLAPSEDALFARLDESCRRAVRKAKGAALVLEVGTGEGLIESYYRVAELSSTRTGEVLPPIDYYLAVWRALSPQAQCTVLLAKAGATTVGALILLVDKGGATFHAGVSDPDYLSVRVNDFLHWEAILWARRTGLQYYRFGPWFPTVDPDWPIATVSRFKKKFGGRPLTIIQGSCFRHPEKYRAAAERHVEELFRKRGLVINPVQRVRGGLHD